MARITTFFRSAAALAALGLVGSAPPLTHVFMPHGDCRNRGGCRRNRTGLTYPHSSARQRARYARQIAAGRLSMERI